MNVTDESKNLHHDLKQDIIKLVSKLRKAISVLKNELTEKDRKMNKLKVELKNAEQLGHSRGNRFASQRMHATPSVSGQWRSLSNAREPLHNAPPMSQNMNYSVVAGGSKDAQWSKNFKLLVKSKTNQSIEYIKTLIKTKLNPVKMKVGINSFRGLKSGQLLIESNKKAEIDTICKNINEKCGGEVEAIKKSKNYYLQHSRRNYKG